MYVTVGLVARMTIQKRVLRSVTTIYSHNQEIHRIRRNVGGRIGRIVGIQTRQDGRVLAVGRGHIYL